MLPAAESEPGLLQVREGRALGSRLRLVAFSDVGLDTAWGAIVAEFAAVDATMSRFRADSEITLLNETGRTASLAPRLRIALMLTDRARRVTAGRFDPRVLWDMERLGFVGAALDRRLPGRDSLQDGPGPPPVEHRPASGDRVVCRSAVAGYELLEPVDLGGIGKGLALRWAVAVGARSLGDPFLIDAGGDLAARGSPPGGWSIGIEDPMGDGPIATCSLGSDQAIATSSVRVGRREEPGGTVHHLVDPATGRPGGAGLAAVTVAWPDPAWAEVWSKALFLAGAKGIAAEARSRGLAAWWIADDGQLSMTPAARAVTTWVRDEASRPTPAPRVDLAPRRGQPSLSRRSEASSHSQPGHGSIGSRPFEPSTRLISPR